MSADPQPTVPVEPPEVTLQRQLDRVDEVLDWKSGWYKKPGDPWGVGRIECIRSLLDAARASQPITATDRLRLDLLRLDLATRLHVNSCVTEHAIDRHYAEADRILAAFDKPLAALRAPAPLAAPSVEGLPPGPYRVEWPAEQGGLFKVWGAQGTPPDFADGWALPFVAIGTQSVMEWLADHLNALQAETPEPTAQPAAPLDAAWAAAEAALRSKWPRGFHGPSLWHEDKGWCAAGVAHSMLRPMPVTVKGEPTPAAALLALAARLAEPGEAP